MADNDLDIAYEDGYFDEGEKFKFGDQALTYKEIKDLVNKAKNPAPPTPPADAEAKAKAEAEAKAKATADVNAKAQADGQANAQAQNGGGFTEDQLKIARMQMDGKISTVLTTYKVAKGEELSRAEIEEELKSMGAQGKQITLDSVDSIAEAIVTRKKEAKAKATQDYIDQKRREPTTLTKSAISVRDNNGAQKNVKIDTTSVMSDFEQYRKDKTQT